jgi:DNA modification methylase
MRVAYAGALLTVYLGDCLEVLPSLPDVSVHAVVTDPPYGLEFMGQDWDAPWAGDPAIGHTWQNGTSRPGFTDQASRLPWPTFEVRANVRCRRCQRWRVSSNPCRCADPGFPDLHAKNMHAYQAWCQAWATECLRVLKPGGHLVAFGGTRTYHRLACAIEDAGFEIRDSIHWIYGQGFPKSLNVAKAIDKAERGVRHMRPDPSSPNHGQQKTHATGGRRGDGDAGRGYGAGPGQLMAAPGATVNDRTLTPAAQAWDGWGTALKPAHEPILLARKPLAGTVAANVTAHRTGALHINACRSGDRTQRPYTVKRWKPGATLNRDGGPWKRDDPGAPIVTGTLPPGRWPANILFTHAPGCSDDGACAAGCPVADLRTQAGVRRSGANPVRRNSDRFRTVYSRFTADRVCIPVRGAETGGADRFFPVFRYQPKATSAERPTLPGITHPTVKPLALMRWLVRLITPPGGVVLDVFAGTGTTLHACLLEGMHGIGIERDESYAALCTHRLRSAAQTAAPARPPPRTTAMENPHERRPYP